MSARVSRQPTLTADIRRGSCVSRTRAIGDSSTCTSCHSSPRRFYRLQRCDCYRCRAVCLSVCPSDHPSTRSSKPTKFRAALSIWWALRTSPCRGPNPSVDRRVRWMCRLARGPRRPAGKKISCYKMFILL